MILEPGCCMTCSRWILPPTEPCAGAGGALGIMAFLPRQTSLAQLSEALPPASCCEVERMVLNGHLKGITLYVGRLARTM